MELAQYGFPAAKVSYQRAGPAYVLCLYAPGASGTRELAARLGSHQITWPGADLQYRYGKSHDATQAGLYSEQFRRARHHR
ncbi:MAG: hypothetical protein ACP5QO_14985 [Clostridia bacterium]